MWQRDDGAQRLEAQRRRLVRVDEPQAAHAVAGRADLVEDRSDRGGEVHRYHAHVDLIFERRRLDEPLNPFFEFAAVFHMKIDEPHAFRFRFASPAPQLRRFHRLTRRASRR